MTLSVQEVSAFQKVVWDHFAKHSRPMPWRENLDPYWIVVSEMMLQQTQVDRVQPKFILFVTHFPSFAHLAAAPLKEVLGLWVGLGYNRRAQFLHNTAKEVVERWNGVLPATKEELVSLPGIGPNTAGAILAYAFNQPVVFIETNVRSVLLHHFFADEKEVSETAIHEIATQVLDGAHPREWYWALMDYGTFIKKTHGNNIMRAKSYRKQSAFKGSLRQVRGQVIAALANQPLATEELEVAIPDPRLAQVMAQLKLEKLIKVEGNRVQLAE